MKTKEELIKYLKELVELHKKRIERMDDPIANTELIILYGEIISTFNLTIKGLESHGNVEHILNVVLRTIISKSRGIMSKSTNLISNMRNDASLVANAELFEIVEKFKTGIL